MLIVDTSPLAAADVDDRDHRRGAALFESEPGPFVTTGLVVAEAAYLIARQTGPAGEIEFCSDVAHRRLRVEGLVRTDWIRVHELVARYADLPLGATDASASPQSPPSMSRISGSCDPTIVTRLN